MAGIYIHIPFCKKACHYCDFHFSTSPQYKDQMLNALRSEIILRKDYLDTEKIETKNYVAVFTFEPRKDGRSASGRTGGINTSDAQSMVLLRKITLYSKPDYNANSANLALATPIKEVVFDYNYSLCRNYPGNDENTSTDVTKGGKLTLIGIHFTYQNSKKMKYRNYQFSYGTAGTRLNPNYHIKGADRWGTYKEPVSSSLSESLITTPLNNSDFPYAEQDPAKANDYASAWNLVKIELPSGGEINVTYESDDYGFVQHKKAAQMFQIIVTAYWELGGQRGEETAETFRYAPLFQQAAQ